MPHKIQSACYNQGCSKRREVGSQYCKEHLKKSRKIYDEHIRKKKSHEIYDLRWIRLRAWFLKRNPLCVDCRNNGKDMIATLVHHIIPITGKDDVRMYDVGNCMALCSRCHNIRHKRFEK